ncbi:hypothetical protein [Rhizobium ruizarguesonis]|uniref:hypothetical protein n=1 Tax=Rhizobium ruizarguesonis TaxID=2081791 RepID=UPI0010309ACA|nr:hypothetical protein [Rhizobium ruizarguesonis]TBD48986.1 hypothetical protein ELH17_18755 [Rhizobium ruizarguesonis]TBD70096.1 hypothetical protein ELH16_18455 [Rhizobium ruizarguesonis]TBF10617.1 hypothetical protein ELG96_18745 [Rhizobium ruizarguesonis]
MARRLADHDGLDQIAHDGHQPLLGLFIGIVAGEEDELADDDLHISGIELRLELGDLLLKILHRLCQCIQLRRQLLGERPVSGFWLGARLAQVTTQKIHL